MKIYDNLTIEEKRDMLMNYQHYFWPAGEHVITEYIDDNVPDDQYSFYIDVLMEDEEIFELFEIACA